MQVKSLLKNTVNRYVAERVTAEVANEVRVLFYTRLPNLLYPTRWMQFRNARKMRGIKVNIGSGPFLEPGWIGIDNIAPKALKFDIKGKFPFQDGACRFLFTEHVLEHLDLKELHRILLECYRILEPGGVLRIITPHLDRYVDAYIAKDMVFSQNAWNEPLLPAQMLNHIFRNQHAPVHS